MSGNSHNFTLLHIDIVPYGVGADGSIFVSIVLWHYHPGLTLCFDADAYNKDHGGKLKLRSELTSLHAQTRSGMVVLNFF